MSESGWSETRVTTLSQLWRDGLSASQIAKQLGGVTRNAVIGKVHRLGLSGRAAASAPARAPRTATPRPTRPRRVALVAPAVRKPPVRLPAQAHASAPEGPGLIGDMAQLGAHLCKWPIGDPKSPDFSFCGRQADGRYCGVHEQAGVRPGTAWRADRDPIIRRALAGLL
jgi:GcrA cell cycle regulator